jgi:hypothetical protein
MKKLVFLHDVSPEDSIDDLVDMAMRAIHGDGPWPEDDDEDEAVDERASDAQPNDEDPAVS